jgi:Kef-type K+ transport system membrane component KefB
MHIEAKHILLFIAIILLFANRILQNKPFIAKHSNHIRILVFLVLIIVLVLEFIKTKAYVVFIIAALGIFSIGWIIYDSTRKDLNEDFDSSGKKDESDHSDTN